MNTYFKAAMFTVMCMAGLVIGSALLYHGANFLARVLGPIIGDDAALALGYFLPLIIFLFYAAIQLVKIDEKSKDYRRAAAEAGMYDIPEEEYIRASERKSASVTDKIKEESNKSKGG